MWEFWRTSSSSSSSFSSSAAAAAAAPISKKDKRLPSCCPQSISIPVLQGGHIIT
jgi:hypothetical protein